MADQTHIEWTDATWNIVTGCSVVSPGCTNCYAMRLAGTRLQHHPSRAGLTVDSKAGPVWNGQVRFNAEWLTQPLRWTKPRRIFVAAHGDLFHDGVTDDQLDQIFAVMALCPQHTFQILTKRPERMRAYLTDNGGDRSFLDFRIGEHFRRLGADFNRDHFGYRLPLPNVWLGVSVEDQARADERIPILLDTPAAVRWISAEPLLGPVDLTDLPFPKSCDCADEQPAFNALDATVYCPGCCEGPEAMTGGTIGWVVAGGESGPGARPMHPDWARQLRDQCTDAGVPFLFKQWGEWREAIEGDEYDTSKGRAGNPPAFLMQRDGTVHCFRETGGEGGVPIVRVGKKAAGRLLDGLLHDGFPEARP